VLEAGLGGSAGHEVRLKIDVGSTKRTTILKKLRALSQDVRFILQVEAHPSTALLSPVVLSVTPRVSDLVRIFNLETSFLPPDACDGQGNGRAGVLAGDEPSAGIVDELWIVVLLHFAELMLDFCHLLLAIFTLFLPWRAVQLLFAVSETDKRAAWREALELYQAYCDGKDCLMDYKAGIAPLMNTLSKQTDHSRTDTYYGGRYGYYYHHPLAVTTRLKDLERRTWREYEAIMTRVQKQASKSSASVQALGDALLESQTAEEMRLQQWAFRTTFNTLPPEAEQQWQVIAKRPPEADDEQGSVSALLVQVVEATAARADEVQKKKDVLVEQQLEAIREEMLEEARTGNKGKPLSWRKRWGGLARRSTGELRKLVQRHFKLALQDLGYILTFLLVCVTFVRILPLLKDLVRLGSWRLTAPGPRRLLLLHLRGAGQDAKRTGKLLFYTSLVLMLGVGIPSFLRKLPGRMRSLEDATSCAQEHVRDTCKYLCELLLLFTAWRTYKLLVTATLYAVLVPPACLAEAIPRALQSVQMRFITGVMVWFALAVGAFFLTLHTDSASDEDTVRAGFLALFGTLTAVVAASTVSLQRRSIFRNPIVDSSTGFFSFSWTHIFAVLLGPIECLQLCSVVLFFFWNDNSEGGNFTFPVVFMFDTPDSDLFFDYQVAMGLASCCVFLWVVVVSLPLVFDSEDVQERAKMRSLQRSPVFDALHVLFSRLLFVSLLATLLRPFSCIMDDGRNDLVLSTDRDELCGGHESFFSGSASSVLLIFFVITSTVLHADSPDMMNAPDYVTNGEAHSSVRFAPLYALVIHLGQLLLCVLCLGFPGSAVGSDSKRALLLCVAIVAALLCMWCALYPWRSCSLPCVGPIRAAGFAVVAFGACLCYIRETEFLSEGSHWRDQTVFFPVAAVMFFAGGVGGYWAQHRSTEQWTVLLQAAGLGDALEGIVALGEVLLVEEALGGSSDGARRRTEAILAKVKECRSAPALGLLLVRFEEQILAERLRHHFLVSRGQWRAQLLGGSHAEDDAEKGSAAVAAVSFDHVVQGVQALVAAVRPRAPLALVNKHLVAMVFINHLPEYVAWEVFKFMYDVVPLAQALQPLLLTAQKGALWGPTHAQRLLQCARHAETTLRLELYGKQEEPS